MVCFGLGRGLRERTLPSDEGILKNRQSDKLRGGKIYSSVKQQALRGGRAQCTTKAQKWSHGPKVVAWDFCEFYQGNNNINRDFFSLVVINQPCDHSVARGNVRYDHTGKVVLRGSSAVSSRLLQSNRAPLCINGN